MELILVGAFCIFYHWLVFGILPPDKTSVAELYYQDVARESGMVLGLALIIIGWVLQLIGNWQPKRMIPPSEKMSWARDLGGKTSVLIFIESLILLANS